MFACSSHSRVPTLRTSADAFSASELRHSKAKPRFCLNAVKRESSKTRGGAAENCFIKKPFRQEWLFVFENYLLSIV